MYAFMFQYKHVFVPCYSHRIPCQRQPVLLSTFCLVFLLWTVSTRLQFHHVNYWFLLTLLSQLGILIECQQISNFCVCYSQTNSLCEATRQITSQITCFYNQILISYSGPRPITFNWLFITDTSYGYCQPILKVEYLSN